MLTTLPCSPRGSHRACTEYSVDRCPTLTARCSAPLTVAFRRGCGPSLLAVTSDVHLLYKVFVHCSVPVMGRGTSSPQSPAAPSENRRKTSIMCVRARSSGPVPRGGTSEGPARPRTQPTEYLAKGEGRRRDAIRPHPVQPRPSRRLPNNIHERQRLYSRLVRSLSRPGEASPVPFPRNTSASNKKSVKSGVKQQH